MMILVYLFGGILLLTFLVIIAGITRHDMRSISRDKRYNAHPHAKKWKKRPLISIIIDGEPTAECLRSIRKSDYRKIEIVTVDKPISGELIMTMAADTKLERHAISAAVRELHDNPRRTRVELLPVITDPQTVRQLLVTYRRLLSALFIAARSGLDVTLPHSSWPTIIRPIDHSLNGNTRFYLALKWFVQLLLVIVLAYVTYLAVGLQQPHLFVAFIAAFAAWTVWSIISYKQLSFVQKFTYVLLSPVSYGYFLYRGVAAPLKIRQYYTLLPTRKSHDMIPLIETKAEGKA